MADALRVLILRMSAAGDIIHGSPVASALKAANPNCHVSWLVEDRFVNLLEDNPHIDELIVVPRRAWKEWTPLARAREVLTLIKRIRKLNITTTLDLQGLTKSALPGFFSGASCRIGFSGRDGREISRILNNTLVDSSATHVVDRNLDLLGPLNIPAIPPHFPVPKRESVKINHFLQDNALIPKDFLIINPGAGWEAKRWPVDRFGILAKKITQHTDKKAVVTWGGEKEKKMAQAIVDAGGEKCIIAPDTDLHELWLLLAAGKMMVSCDTGPLHMAAAAGVDTIALFGPTSGVRNGPYGPDHMVVQGRCPNHPLCWKKRYRNACTCMDRITPDMVLDACKALLSREGTDNRRNPGEAEC